MHTALILIAAALHNNHVESRPTSHQINKCPLSTLESRSNNRIDPVAIRLFSWSVHWLIDWWDCVLLAFSVVWKAIAETALYRAKYNWFKSRLHRSIIKVVEERKGKRRASCVVDVIFSVCRALLLVACVVYVRLTNERRFCGSNPVHCTMYNCTCMFGQPGVADGLCLSFKKSNVLDRRR